ncbi:MAG: DNA repair protein RadA [Chloroflexi bacterium]|nr:DNA repair protein RadA [Chloroflexota bacterium]
MPRSHTKYVCQQCGGQYPTGYGRCPGCGSWQSLVETIDRPAGARGGFPRVVSASSTPVPLARVESVEHRRLRLPIEEFNRVLGGGIVPGSLVLLGGDPGIGKSTLLLQISNLAALHCGRVLYATGEESAEQVKLRADRLGGIAPDLYILAETDVDAIIGAAQQMEPALLVVDSIQTVQTADLDSPSGSVGQVRESATRLTQLAKKEGIATFLVGHVTKEGSLAGPKVLEHMVDTVLYLEGDHHHAYRLLRSVKNRFGATNEVGVFDMQDSGLAEVSNPSAAFLSERESQTAGSLVTVTLEGSRPLLIELQALVTPTHFGLPRRTANGVDLNRLILLTAVLSKRTGLPLGNQDVYVNVVGGLRLTEPALDLSAALAIASSLTDTPISDAAVIGEVGLGGEVRSVNQIRRRVAEAQKLGFARCIVPKRNLRELREAKVADVVGVGTLLEALEVTGCTR